MEQRGGEVGLGRESSRKGYVGKGDLVEGWEEEGSEGVEERGGRCREGEGQRDTERNMDRGEGEKVEWGGNRQGAGGGGGSGRSVAVGVNTFGSTGRPLVQVASPPPLWM